MNPAADIAAASEIERKAREQLVEPETERKAPEQSTESKTLEGPATRKKPKYYENRKARAAREVQEGLRAYRLHRTLEELAACKAREESAAREELRCRKDLKVHNTIKAQERRRLYETPKARGAREASVRHKARSVYLKERKARKAASATVARRRRVCNFL